MPFQVKIIIASTRPGRKGPAIAEWFYDLCEQRQETNFELLDLAEINLPFLDEPNHPSIKKYTKLHTMQWSKTIDEGDAFVFITPEYNFGYPATLKNAIDFLFLEWGYKPAAFVSYGGLSAGTRATQQLKQIVSAVNMMPIKESVNIPFFSKHIDASGRFSGDEILVKSANTMLDELLKWTAALSTLRK